MTNNKIPKLTKRNMEKYSEIVIDTVKFLDIIHRTILSKNTLGKGKWAIRKQRIARNMVVGDTGFYNPGTDDVMDYMNRVFEYDMKDDRVKRIIIRFDDGKERVFHKPIVSDPEFVNIPPHKSPVKMKSKKMCHKKSQTKKSPVTCMTGNIGKMGKNFKNLI